MHLIEGNNAFDVYQRCDKGTVKCGFALCQILTLTRGKNPCQKCCLSFSDTSVKVSRRHCLTFDVSRKWTEPN